MTRTTLTECLPLRIRFDVKANAPDLDYLPHAIVATCAELPPGRIVGASYADALERGAAALIGVPERFRLPDDIARQLIPVLRRLQDGSAELLACLGWLLILGEAQAARAPMASVSDLRPRHLLFPPTMQHPRKTAKVGWADVDDAAYAAHAAAAQAARAIADCGNMLDEIEASLDGAAFRASATYQLSRSLRLRTATVLQHGVSVLGDPIEVIGPEPPSPRITLPSGIVEWPRDWVRHQAARWKEHRSHGIERLRRFRADPTRPGGW